MSYFILLYLYTVIISQDGMEKQKWSALAQNQLVKWTFIAQYVNCINSKPVMKIRDCNTRESHGNSIALKKEQSFLFNVYFKLTFMWSENIYWRKRQHGPEGATERKYDIFFLVWHYFLLACVSRTMVFVLTRWL